MSLNIPDLTTGLTILGVTNKLQKLSQVVTINPVTGAAGLNPDAQPLGRKNTPSAVFDWLHSEGYSISAVNGPGNVVVKGRPIERAIANHGILNSSECYVDNVSGLDTNAGTAALPFKTLAKALRASAFGHIKLLPTGVMYDVCDYRGTDTGAGALKVIEGLGDVVIGYIGTDISAATWTMTSGTGSVSVTGASSSTPNRVLDSRQTINGKPKPLRQYTSLAALNAASVGWFYDSGATMLHVRSNSVDINAIKGSLRAVYSSPAGKLLVYAAKLALRNVTIEGVYMWNTELGGVASWVFAEDCTLQYSNFQGMQAEGGHYRFSNVRVHRSRLDGINSKNKLAVIGVTGLEINCFIDFAGDPDTFGDALLPPLSNGAYNINCSANDSYPGGSTVWLGGRYLVAQGPVVVAAGAAGTPSNGWAIGIVAKGSIAKREGLAGSNHEILANNGLVWLDTCEASGSDSDGDIVSAGTSGIMYVDAQSTGTIGIALGGSLGSWTPS